MRVGAGSVHRARSAAAPFPTGGAGGEGPGGDREPALLLGDERRLGEHPAPRAVAVREVEQDGVRIRQAVRSVFQHRHLAEGIQREEAR